MTLPHMALIVKLRGRKIRMQKFCSPSLLNKQDLSTVLHLRPEVGQKKHNRVLHLLPGFLSS